MIRVLVKHDQRLWRTALARGLAAVQGISMVADLAPEEDLVAAGRRTRPHVVVHEAALLLPEQVASICMALPDSSVLLLADPRQAAGIRPDLAALAPRVGIMTTCAPFERFVEAIHQLTRGEAVIDAGVALATLRAQHNPLTQREQEVLRHVVTGATTGEIAEKLFLQVGTVRNYLSNAIQKSGGRSRIDAVRIAQEAGWI